jgi:methylated-DNA-[protein]-cysteine S-methyltransferase
MMTNGATSSIAIASPVGPLTITARAGRLIALRFGDGAVGPEPRPSAAVLDHAAAQLEEYFEGRRDSFELPRVLPDSEFDRRVLEAADRIPYGERSTYGAIAAELGLPAERARDVGGALGRNPLPIVVPCHRVVGADGGLTGYGGGLERKAFLLDFEAPQLLLE